MATPTKQPVRTAAPAKQAAKPAAQAARPVAQQARQAVPAQAQSKPLERAAQQQAVNNQAKPPVLRQTQASVPAVPNNNALVIPDYIRKDGQARGSENVEMADLVIPRIELVQALSKCLIEGSGEYIEDAKPGMFYNSVTRTLYGPALNVIPVFFKKQYLAWRDRKTTTGGFAGAFDKLSDAQARIAEQEDADKWEAIETAQQMVLVYNPDTGDTDEAVISCARTKMKVSRQWNSLIRINGFDRFSRMYTLFSTDEQNAKGDHYKNIAIQYLDFTPMEAYKRAETTYESIASGARAFKVDDKYEDTEDNSIPGEVVGRGGQGDDPGPSEY